MSAPVASSTRPGPTALDALSLLTEVADELVVRTARDTHLAVLDRVERLTRGEVGTGGLHRQIAGTVYGGVGLGLRLTGRGLDRVSASGPGMQTGAGGRFLLSAVNGLIGDRLLRERPQLAIPMAVRVAGDDVEPTRSALGAAFPQASGSVAVFLHGLCENESHWRHRREQVGSTYPEMLTERGWTPVLLRVNTGLPLRENGAALAALMQRLVDCWPVAVTRIALVGHSLGGLVIRAAGAVVGDVEPHWSDLVSDVVTLGSPHLGAPLAAGVGLGSRGLGRLPETASFGRILDQRSQGVHDLVVGLAEDVPPLPHARYHLVAGTLTRRRRHPVGHLLGDLLVRSESALGRGRRGRALFPDADVLHVGGTDHFGLLNHPRVHGALREWLA